MQQRGTDARAVQSEVHKIRSYCYGMYYIRLSAAPELPFMALSSKKIRLLDHRQIVVSSAFLYYVFQLFKCHPGFFFT